MTAVLAAPLVIHTYPDEVPSVPDWFAELTVLARYFTRHGVLDAISEQVRLARGRAGHYEVIDFVALLLGYALSGEPTLEAFFDRLQPFARPFMALFGRDHLPHRSSLSRFLAAVDADCLEALRRRFDHDLGHHGPTGDLLGGLCDRCGHRLVLIDVDATRQATRQRALATAGASPQPRRRRASTCAPGYLGRKRGEVVRTRTTVLQAHTQQWLGTFSGAGNGDYGAELDAACRATLAYLQAKGLRPAHVLLRLDALYGTASPLARIQRAGLGFLTRGRDYQLLDHPRVQARLEHPCDVVVQHPETRVRRELFEVGYIADWLAPVPELALTCRVIVARQPAPEGADAVGSGKRRGPHVYELFLTSAPGQCLRADEVVELYHQRGAFERVLRDEDAEQDPDRWCSCTPRGQEFWQIVSQWVWNTRLGLGMVGQGQALRQTRWSATLPDGTPSPAGRLSEAPPADQPEAAVAVALYGPLEVARDWGRASGRFAGHAFAVLEDGTLRCPADMILRPQERRTQADGSLRIVYRAKKEACRACAFARECLGQQASGEQPRRVSAVRKRITRPGGTSAALLHEDPPPAATSAAPHELTWWDLPGYRIRREYVLRLRRQTVTIAASPSNGEGAEMPGAPRTWTRAERAHRRLSWAARLARNGGETASSGYMVTVFGIAPALAAVLGLSTDPPE